MRNLTVRYRIALFFFIIAAIIAAPIAHAKEGNTIRIDWKAIEDAKGYTVEVTALDGKKVLEKKVSENFIELSLPPGSYRVRIGTINIFDRLSSWSDWEEIRVLKGRPPKLPGVRIRISAGAAYHQIITPWNKYFDPSYMGGMLRAGISGESGFFSYTGIESEAGYIKLESASVSYPGDLKGEMLWGGGNLFFRTGFDFPLNLVFRAGAGASQTRMSYTAKQTINATTTYTKQSPSSIDLYARGGLALEWRFYKGLFLEIGADYTRVFYTGKDLSEIRYNALVGVVW